MSVEPDDPRLTAYALGELDESDRPALYQRLAEDEGSRRTVAEVRALADSLRQGLGEERSPGLSEDQRQAIRGRLAVRDRRPSFRFPQGTGPAPALLAAGLLGTIGLGLWWTKENASPATVAMDDSAGPPPTPKAAEARPERESPPPSIVAGRGSIVVAPARDGAELPQLSGTPRPATIVTFPVPKGALEFGPEARPRAESARAANEGLEAEAMPLPRRLGAEPASAEPPKAQLAVRGMRPSREDALKEKAPLADLEAPLGRRVMGGGAVDENRGALGVDRFFAFTEVNAVPKLWMKLEVGQQGRDLGRFRALGEDFDREPAALAFGFDDRFKLAKKAAPDAPLSLGVALADCPWNARNRLGHVQLLARTAKGDEAPDGTVARDVALAVHFDAEATHSYRWLWSEPNLLALGEADPAPAKGLQDLSFHYGERTEALVELVPADRPTARAYFTAVATYKDPARPEAPLLSLEAAAQLPALDFREAPAEVRFAASRAAFALARSLAPGPQVPTLEQSLVWAQSSLGKEPRRLRVVQEMRETLNAPLGAVGGGSPPAGSHALPAPAPAPGGPP